MLKLSKFFLFPVLILNFFASVSVKSLEAERIKQPELSSNTQVLHLLAGHLKINALKKIIKKHKTIFNACANLQINDKKQTLLMAAIESTKSPKIKNGKICRSSDVIKAKYKKQKLVKLLIKHGADLTAVDADGNNCLHLAVKAGDAKIVNYIIEAATSKKRPAAYSLTLLNTPNKLGQTAPQLAESLYKDPSTLNEETIFLGLNIKFKDVFPEAPVYYFDDAEYEEIYNKTNVWQHYFDNFKDECRYVL